MADEAPATPTPTGPKPTLGLTGLTINAMALIAPGAFLWLTYFMQSNYGAPMAGSGMWFGILVALALCFATAIAYAELSKLYPGAGSSYFFAEQAFANKTTHAHLARVAKFVTGWASHLYYWGYPGVMVGVTALVVGYFVGSLWPNTFNAATPSTIFMILFCVVFSFGVAYIAFRGVVGATGVNMGINIIQITALLIFSFMAISYRLNHKEGDPGWTLDPDGNAINVTLATYKIDKDHHAIDKDGKVIEADDGTIAPENIAKLVADDNGDPKKAKGKDSDDWIVAKDDKGKDMPFIVSYKLEMDKDGHPTGATTWEHKDSNDDKSEMVEKFQNHPDAASVVKPHSFSYAFIQACIAILILVGFESVTSMGEEAKNAKRDIPRAVLLSLAIQGLLCYLIEYFAANYFLNSGYKMTQAAGSAAPLGDMMKIVGASFFGSANGGWWFMMVQAVTVFLALIGTTLSCMSTGARVTYAMGRDDEVPSHFGLLHGKNLTPHRAIWTLATISVVIGIISVFGNFWGPTAALQNSAIDQLPKNFWYSFGIFKFETASKLPCTMLIMTLVSNFGTFLLYMLTCYTAIVAFRDHHTFSGIKHMFIPVFGVLANFTCMLFYLIGPFMVNGMSWMEPYIALAIAALWGAFGAFYFVRSSKAKGKSIVVQKPAATA
ncbi:MAG TPA: APC family permease [Planctomycetota bacterium]|nr:APC family permease [Planctomycetota bacterium]